MNLIELRTIAIETAEKLINANVPCVSPEDAARLITAMFIDKKGTVQKRSRPSKKHGASTNDAGAFNVALRFHRGENVNLHGIMMYSMLIGEARYNQIDSLALGLTLRTGSTSAGIATWRRVLGNLAVEM